MSERMYEKIVRMLQELLNSITEKGERTTVDDYCSKGERYEQQEQTLAMIRRGEQNNDKKRSD